MMKQDPMQLQSAFVLQTRPYRNTSLWTDLFTKESGRITAIANGARRPKNRYQVPIQPYSPLLVACRGKTELSTLQRVEPLAPAYTITAERLLSGFYLNELLVRLLPRFDPHPHLFETYQQCLMQLADRTNSCEISLRHFEKTLLAQLGYGLTLSRELKTGEAVQASQYYAYFPNEGVQLLSQAALKHRTDVRGNIFIGKHLLAIEHNQFQDSKVLRDAKRLLRIALAARLGNKVLHSRALFIQMRHSQRHNATI